MNRFVAMAALGAGLVLARSASASTEVETFDANVTSPANTFFNAVYGSFGAPFTTFTSNPTNFEIMTHNYGSAFKQLPAAVNGTGNTYLQLDVTVNAGVAGVIIDLNSPNAANTGVNGESFKFYGLTPGNGTNGTNEYTLTAPLAPSAANYFDGTGVLDISNITQMNVEIDPGAGGSTPYDVQLNDLSLVNVPEPTSLATAGTLGCLLIGRRRRASSATA